MSQNRSRKADLWAHRIESWKASGLSQQQWCEENSLSKSSLQYWLAKQTTKKLTTSQFTEVVDRAEDSYRAGLQVRIGVATIEIPPDFDEQVLRRLMKVLGAAL